jgi:uncharacterized phage-like protein YoqJ
MIIAATGHRPDKLGGYHPRTQARLQLIAAEGLRIMEPSRVISGMALGWDTAVALAAIDLFIPLTAAVPFKGQESRWPEGSRRTYREILSMADEVVTVCEGGYHPAKLQVRNEYMVNQAEEILALWNGTPGGTRNCIDYAKEMRRPIYNVWSMWEESRRPSDLPRVWNRRNPCAPADAVNIMRGSPYGNKFVIGALWPERNVWMTRDDVCDRFEREVLPTLDVSRLRGRDLLCCCKPKRCHGDAILRKANA